VHIQDDPGFCTANFPSGQVTVMPQRSESNLLNFPRGQLKQVSRPYSENFPAGHEKQSFPPSRGENLPVGQEHTSSVSVKTSDQG
jgi:hypothetical protein